jgi:DNA-binding beta-propeller fold protein YncE
MNRTPNRIAALSIAIAAASVSGCAHVSTAPAATACAVRATYPVPGPGRWDLIALDPPRHHVFVSRGDRVQVVDARDGHLAGEIAGTDGVHGIAVVPALHRGFITDGRSNAVTEFDLDSLQRVRDFPVSGKSPDAVLFEPRSGRLFVFNAHSNNASVIDPADGREIAVIAFEGNPELAADDAAGHVFVNIEDKAQLVRIDAASARVTETWALDDCDGPTGLAMDEAHARVFSACQNGIMLVSDAATGRQVARVAIGDGPDGLAFDPGSQMAFSPNGGSGNLTVVHEDDPDHFRVVQTLPTMRSARTIALDPATHRLYLPAAQFGSQPAEAGKRPAMLPGSFRLIAVW